MPIIVEKEVTTNNSDPLTNQVSQSATTTQVATGGEVKDAQADRGNAWIWYIIGIIDFLLVTRFVFNLLAARSVGFADLLYNITSPLVAPFRGIFPNSTADSSYFDMASLVAIVAYMALGWIVSRLIDLVTRPTNSQKI
jgi:uncharacterized protein YggT (Ycf19 family)